MAVDGYLPKITLPSDETDIRKGDGLLLLCSNGRVMDYTD